VQERDSQSHLGLGYTLFGVEWQQRFTHAGVSHALLGEIRVPLGMWWFLVGHDKDKHDRRKRAAAAAGSNFSSPSSRVQAAAAASTPGPSDDDRLAAEKALERARDDSARGNYALAADALTRAYALDPDPFILLRLADADEKQGRLVAASRELQRFLRAARTPEATEHEAQVTERMQALQLRLAQLRLTCPDAHGDETVLVDNEPAPGALLGYDVPLDPGSHALVISRAGAELLRRNVVAEEGKIVRVDLTLTPPPAAAGAPAAASEARHD
jgi:tetratricopeptide (TPR) repeat protein